MPSRKTPADSPEPDDPASHAQNSQSSQSAAPGPELIWLRPERTGRGPRPAHSRASIAATAVALADAEGLDAVTMRRIAAELGAGTMSLYNYVPKKEQLFDLMLDAVAGEYQLPDAPSGDWRADLTMLAHQQLDILRRHGWVSAAIRVRPSFGPNSLRYTEFFLGAVAGLDLSGGAKMEALAMLNGALCQFADWERATTAAATSPERWQLELAGYLTQVAAGGGYPNLTAALMGSAGQQPDMEASFERLIDKMLTVMLQA